jgi:hypothetical protein
MAEKPDSKEVVSFGALLERGTLFYLQANTNGCDINYQIRKTAAIRVWVGLCLGAGVYLKVRLFMICSSGSNPPALYPAINNLFPFLLTKV